MERWSLIVAILGSGMAFLDGTVVNVALPVMQRALGATAGQLQWVVEAYALLLASLVLVGGALGDRLGRRAVFSAGVALFALASAACGAAPGIRLLIVARAVQGAGAALLVPGSLALISAAYPAQARGAAIGTWSAWSAITAAVGPVAGRLGRRTRILALALLLQRPGRRRGRRAGGAPRSRRRAIPTPPPRIDVAGAALATIGLGLLVYALIDAGPGGARLRARARAAGARRGGARRASSSSRRACKLRRWCRWGCSARAPSPATNLLTLLLYAALGGAMFFVPFNLIQVQGYCPAAAGAALLPFVVLLSTMSRWAGALAAKIGPRLLLGVRAAGGRRRIPAAGAARPWAASYWTHLLPGRR